MTLLIPVPTKGIKDTYKTSNNAFLLLKTRNTLKDYENASPRLNPLLHKP